jgi:hypothetical protein
MAPYPNSAASLASCKGYNQSRSKYRQSRDAYLKILRFVMAIYRAMPPPPNLACLIFLPLFSSCAVLLPLTFYSSFSKVYYTHCSKRDLFIR